jgi:hypothetical protein
MAGQEGPRLVVKLLLGDIHRFMLILPAQGNAGLPPTIEVEKFAQVRPRGSLAERDQGLLCSVTGSNV